MVKVIVESEFMEVIRTFKSDIKSIAYLKKVKNIHLRIGKLRAGIKPRRGDYGRYGTQRYQHDMKSWKSLTNSCPVKVVIERIV